jgi:cytidine deaminase
MNAVQRKLFEAASRARLNSYSPYSGHQVGAAIRVKGGRIFGGCNVENSSYGGTNCAERVAIQNAVSELGRIEIEEILVVTDSAVPWPPCGLCRQVIAEFAPGTTPLHSTNLQETLRTTTVNEIFPEAFTPEFLKRS